MFGQCSKSDILAIMYKKELELCICELTDFNSSRIIGLDIKRSHDRSLYIFGIYLPFDNTRQSYSTELNLLEDLVAHSSSSGDVFTEVILTLALLRKRVQIKSV